MKNYFSFALNNLKRRKLRAWLTILGIFIGIAAVVSLISLGDGLRTAVTGQFSALSTDRLTIQNSGTGFGPPGSTSIRKLTSHDVDVIKNVDGVDDVVSRLIRIVKVEYNDVLQFNYVVSIPDDQKLIDLGNTGMGFEIESGRLLKAGDSKQVVLGSDIVKSDAFGKKIEVGKNLQIQGESFRVLGTLTTTGMFQTNLAIFMPEKDLKEILNIGDETDLIVALIKKGYDIEKVAKRIEDALRKDRKEKIGEEDFSVQTPLQALSSVNTILNIINMIVVGIAAISLLVGGIGIANTMYTSVLERYKEIGTMKAIGAKNSDILYIFLIESGLLGLVGGIIGALIGLGFAFSAAAIANAAFGTTLITVQISWSLVLGAIAFSFLLGIFFGVFPARQASKLKPVDALRG